MNPFLFSIVALCLATTGAIAQYGAAPQQYNSGYSQRKMAPSPQQYGEQQQYGREMASSSSYGEHQQQQSYAAPAPAAYKAPSSAQVSTYDERSPANSGYGKQQQSYARPAQQSYGAAASYAKPTAAAKYEEQYHAPMPFAWGYDINDGYGGAQYHKETGDEYGKRTGSYGYTDAYGIYRQVDYVADEHGFRATIKTNEPGTANESPADVELHAYEPPSNYYAGNTYSANNYGAQQQQQAYGKTNKQSYGAAPSAYGQQQSYGQQQQSYGQQQQQQRSSYGKQQASYQQAPRQSYQQQEQQSYSSSAIVPVYSKVATPAIVAAPAAAAVAAKRY